MTDHNALQWLATRRLDSKRLTRWALMLQEFPFIIKHRPGKENASTDALSHVPVTEPPLALPGDERSTLVAGKRES